MQILLRHVIPFSEFGELKRFRVWKTPAVDPHVQPEFDISNHLVCSVCAIICIPEC